MLKAFKPPVDLTDEFIRLELSYRPDHGGNPAKMFKLDCVVVEQKEYLMHLPAYHDSWESGRHIRQELSADFRASRGEDFVQLFPLLLSIDDEYGHWCPMPIFKFDPEFDALVNTTGDYETWLGTLTTTIMLGQVYHETEPGSKYRSVGEMIKAGKVWKWKAYSAKQLAQLGLPPGFKTLL